MGLDMYLSAKKYNPGGYTHVRSDYLHNEGKPSTIVPKDPMPKEVVEFDGIIAGLGFGTYDEWIKRFPEGTSLEVTLRVAYWRKANAIHAWFVKNVQDGNDNCAEYDVSTEQLAELRDVCKRILEGSDLGEPVEEGGPWGTYTTYPHAKVDVKLAHDLLPSQEGFFFGPTEYGAYYLSDLQDTVTQLDALLDGDTFTGWDFSYRSSW